MPVINVHAHQSNGRIIISDLDTRLKFFLVMPLVDDFIDSEGKPCAPFPHLDYCEITYTRDAAETALLKRQKADPEGCYVLLESINYCERYVGMNEWRLAKTAQW